MSKDIEKAEDVDFTEGQENWNVYKLNDGTTLKVKLILQSVKRLQKWKKDGSPIYLIQVETIERLIDVPKEFKGKPKPSAYDVT